MRVRTTVRRRLIQGGLLAVAASGMMAAAPLAASASAVSHAPAAVSAAHASPASGCGSHVCIK